MRAEIATASILALLLAGCVPRPPPMAMPTDGNAGSMYAWCDNEARRASPSSPITIRGRAYINAFIRDCMLRAGAQPVVIIN